MRRFLIAFVFFVALLILNAEGQTIGSDPLSPFASTADVARIHDVVAQSDVAAKSANALTATTGGKNMMQSLQILTTQSSAPQSALGIYYVYTLLPQIVTSLCNSVLWVNQQGAGIAQFGGPNVGLPLEAWCGTTGDEFVGTLAHEGSHLVSGWRWESVDLNAGTSLSAEQAVANAACALQRLREEFAAVAFEKWLFEQLVLQNLLSSPSSPWMYIESTGTSVSTYRTAVGKIRESIQPHISDPDFGAEAAALSVELQIVEDEYWTLELSIRNCLEIWSLI